MFIFRLYCQNNEQTSKKGGLVLTKDEFLLLDALRESPGATQRSLSEKLGVSLGKIHTLISAARESGTVSEAGKLTEKGLSALEPYRVQNAVIMAAGTSSRFAPLAQRTGHFGNLCRSRLHEGTFLLS